MKRIENKSPQKRLIIYRILILLILLLGITILAGTIYAVFRDKSSAPLFSIGNNAAVNSQQGRSQSTAGEVSMFTGIGRLRIPTQSTGGSTNASTVILSIAFPYPPQDHAFTEELAARITDFRRLATEYFSSLVPAELRNFDEAAAKAELLKRFNSQLRLGKIIVLYFDDLMMIE
jgi:flagellar basal body-associated protein FliL